VLLHLFCRGHIRREHILSAAAMRSPQYCEEHTELVEMERLELNLAPMNISATILLTSALLLRDLTGKCTITNTVYIPRIPPRTKVTFPSLRGSLQ
jgi:hypothetical protein